MKPVRSQEEFDERQAQQAAIVAELDRVMPKAVDLWGSRNHYYECLICGVIVKNRVKHLRWHRGTDVLDVLITLFGRSN